MAGLSESGLRVLVRRLQGPLGRLGVARTRVAGELERRAAVSAGRGHESGAVRDVRRQLGDELNVGQAEQFEQRRHARRAARVAQTLMGGGVLGSALRAGR